MKDIALNQITVPRRRLSTGAIALALVGTLMSPFLAAQPALSQNASLTPLVKASSWLNGTPSQASLRGKVVLVDVFTFACVNCMNITPNLRSLERAKASDGLTIVGIHSPETAYEHDHSAVVTNLKTLGSRGRSQSTTTSRSGTRIISRSGRRSSSSTAGESYGKPSSVIRRTRSSTKRSRLC